jgi:hypothetical protein
MSPVDYAMGGLRSCGYLVETGSRELDAEGIQRVRRAVSCRNLNREGGSLFSMLIVDGTGLRPARGRTRAAAHD